MIYGRRILTTAILLTLLVLSSSMMSTQSTAKEADIIVDTDGTGDYTTIQKAVNNANNGSVIKIKRGIYNSVDIGTCSSCSNNAGQQSIKRLGETDDDDFGEPLSVELRAYKDQFVRIHPATATAEAGIEIANNGGKEVVIEGIVFQDAEYGVAVKTASDVTLRRNAFMNSLNNDILLLNNKFGNIEDTMEVEDKGNFWGTEREEVYFPTDLGESSRYLEYNKEEGLEPEKILQSKRTETLRVDFITGDNYNFQNKYKTLGKAVDHAKSDSTIKVEATEFGKTSEEHYGPVEIAGEGVSENYNLTIVGVAERRAGTIKKLPRLSSLTFSSDGMYTVRNFIIKGEISSVSSNSVVRAQKNDWGGNPYGRLAVIEESGGIVSAYPFCETRSCDEYVSGENSPYCMVVNTPRTDNAGCENKDKNKITVDASGLQSMDATDRFNSTIEVSGDVSRQTTVSLTIYPSDSLEKKTVTLTPQQNSKEVEIKSYFRSTTLGQQVTPALRVSTKDYNPTSMAVYRSIKLSSDSDSGSGSGSGSDSGSDLFDEESSSSATESTAESKVRQNIINSTRRNTTTPVSQFNDGDDVTERYESELIPPTSATTNNPATGNVVTEGVRTFRQTTTFGGRGSLIKSSDENRYRIGTSHTSIPSADSHVLVIQYALSPTEDINGNSIKESIEAKIVNQQNEIISPQREDINLKTSVSGSETIVVQLTQREIDYINNIGNAYVVYDGSINTNKGSSMSLFSQIILSGTSIGKDIERTDEFSNTVFGSDPIGSELPSEEPDDPASEQVQDPPELEDRLESRDSTMTIDYFVEGTKSQFNTYDVAPKEFSNSAQSELRMTFTIRNTGDRSITKDVKIVDKWHHPESPQHYPNRESRVDMNINTETKKNFEVSLGPSETITKTVVMDWSKTKFGYHNLTVKKSNDQGYSELVGANKIEAYVLQPPTFEVSAINDVPQSQLTYTNFDSSVDVVNIGDLGGKKTVKLEFVDWSTTEDIKLSGGNPRIGRTSSVSTISYGSEENANQEQIQNQYRLEYAPLDEAVSVSGTNRNWFENSVTQMNNFDGNDELFRPYSPFYTEPGTYDLKASVDGQNIEVIENVELNSVKREDVELYELQITGLQVNTVGDEDKFESRPSESEVKSYASAYPYTYRSKKATRGGNDVRGFGTMYSIPESGTSPISRAARPMGTGPFSPFTKLKQHSSNDFSYAGYNSNVNKKCNRKAKDIPIIPTSSDSSHNKIVCSGEGSGIKYVQSPRIVEGGAKEITFGQDSTMNGGNAQTYKKDGSTLYARVGIQNPLKDSPAVGRVEIVTNRTQNSRGESVGLGVSGAAQPGVGNDNFGKQVVGSAAVEVPPQTTKYVDIPIVIKNDKGLNGTHVLEVRPRHGEDYIGKSNEAVDDSTIPESPITGQHHSQFEVPVKIQTYGDTILEKYEPKNGQNSYSVNELCTSQTSSSQPDRRQSGRIGQAEGINPISGEKTSSGRHLGFVKRDGVCSDSSGTARFVAQYENYGGEKQKVEPVAISQFVKDTAVDSIHRKQAIESADIRFDRHDLSTPIEDFTIPAATANNNGEHVFNVQKSYREPGTYRTFVAPCRAADSGPKIYNLKGFAGVYREPVSNFETVVKTNNVPSKSRDSEYLRQALFHNSQGCSSSSESVTVKDITKPQPDFTIASDKTTYKEQQQSNQYDSARTGIESIDISTGDYVSQSLLSPQTYNEGRRLAFSGASCSYDGYSVEFPVDGQEPCMTVDNVQVTSLDWTLQNIVDGEVISPNYDKGCENTDGSLSGPYNSCFNTEFSIPSDEPEEMWHRFNEPGVYDVSLEASDGKHTQTATATNSIQIEDDTTIPTLDSDAQNPQTTSETKYKKYKTGPVTVTVDEDDMTTRTYSESTRTYIYPKGDKDSDNGFSIDTASLKPGLEDVSQANSEFGIDLYASHTSSLFVSSFTVGEELSGLRIPFTEGAYSEVDRLRTYIWEGGPTYNSLAEYPDTQGGADEIPTGGCCSSYGVTIGAPQQLINQRKDLLIGYDTAFGDISPPEVKNAAKGKYPSNTVYGTDEDGYARPGIGVPKYSNVDNGLGSLESSDYQLDQGKRVRDWENLSPVVILPNTYDDNPYVGQLADGWEEIHGDATASNIDESTGYKPVTITTTAFADSGFSTIDSTTPGPEITATKTIVGGSKSKQIEYPSITDEGYEPVELEKRFSFDGIDLDARDRPGYQRAGGGFAKFGNEYSYTLDRQVDLSEWQNNPPEAITKVQHATPYKKKEVTLKLTAKKEPPVTNGDIDDASNSERARKGMLSYEYKMDHTRSAWRERSELDGGAASVRTDNDGGGGNDIRELSVGTNQDGRTKYVTDADPGRFLDTDEDHLVFHRNGYSGDSDVLRYGADYGGKFEGTDLCLGMDPEDDEIGVTEIKWNGFTDSGVHVEDNNGDKKCIEYKQSGGQRTDTLGVQLWDAAKNTVDHELDVTVYHDDYAPEVLNFKAAASQNAAARQNIDSGNIGSKNDLLYESTYGDPAANEFGVSPNQFGLVYAAHPSNNFAGGTTTFQGTAVDKRAPESSDEYDVGLACVDIIKGKQFTGGEDEMTGCEKKITDSSGYSNAQEDQATISPSWNMEEISVETSDYSDTFNNQEFTLQATDLHSNNENKHIDLVVVKDQKKATEIDSSHKIATTTRRSDLSGEQEQCRTYMLQGPGVDGHGVGAYDVDVDRRTTTATQSDTDVNTNIRDSKQSDDSNKNDIPIRPELDSYPSASANTYKHPQADGSSSDIFGDDGEVTYCAEVSGELSDWTLKRESQRYKSVAADTVLGVGQSNSGTISNSGSVTVTPPNHYRDPGATYSSVEDSTITSNPDGESTSDTRSGSVGPILVDRDKVMEEVKVDCDDPVNKTGCDTEMQWTGQYENRQYDTLNWDTTTTLTVSTSRSGYTYTATGSYDKTCNGDTTIDVNGDFHDACDSANYASPSITVSIGADYEMGEPTSKTVVVPQPPSGFGFHHSEIEHSTSQTVQRDGGSLSPGDRITFYSYDPDETEELKVRTRGYDTEDTDSYVNSIQDNLNLDRNIDVGSCMEAEAGIDVRFEDYHGNTYYDSWSINEHYRNGRGISCSANLNSRFGVDERSSGQKFTSVSNAEVVDE